MTGTGEDTIWRRLAEGLPGVLPGILPGQRWFGGKARSIRAADVIELIPMVSDRLTAALALARIHYTEGPAETYSLPLVLAAKQETSAARTKGEATSVLRIEANRGEEAIVLRDGTEDPEFSCLLLNAIAENDTYVGGSGALVASSTTVFESLRGPDETGLVPAALKAEQSNSSIRYGDRLVLKLFRRLEEGINPELEIGTFLTERTAFRNTPSVAGTLEYRVAGADPMSLGVLQAFVPNQGDAWGFTLRSLEGFFERVEREQRKPSSTTEASPEGLTGSYGKTAGLLGRRTGELHTALASDPETPAFAPEPFSAAYLESLADSMCTLATRVLPLLARCLPELRAETRTEARRALEHEEEILAELREVSKRPLSGFCTRIHGDYHLGQVLYTGEDFVIIDFEGEPARPTSERRQKRPPLQDVAGMLRSFDYAAHAGLKRYALARALRPEEVAALEPWAGLWTKEVSENFLQGYFAAAAAGSFLPRRQEEREIFLRAHLMEKAIYELGYELNNRPEWVRIPLQGIIRLLGPASQPSLSSTARAGNQQRGATR